jgi:uncharacterized protein (DUF58 family)
LKLIAENRKFLPVWLQIKVPISGLIDSSSGERELIKEDSLLWHQKAQFEWDVIPRRRGVHPIGPPRLRAGDLFAFFSREKETGEIHQIIVYPRIIPLKKFSLPRRDFFGAPGSKSAVRDPIYILGTRDYQNGKPAKHIHWKASARHHRLQEKVFEPTEQEKVLMAVEVSAFAGHQAGEEFERTLEAVASLAVRLDKRGCALGLVTNGAIFGGGAPTIPLARTPEQLPAILEVLARVQMEAQGDLLDIVRRGLGLRWGLSCVHFSLQADRTMAPTGEFFRQRKIPAMFLTCRPDSVPANDRSEAWPKVISLDDISMREDLKG